MKPCKHIYINHATENRNQRMFTYDNGNPHIARLCYLVVCSLDGGTVTTKKTVYRLNKKNKSLHHFYDKMIRQFEKKYDDCVLHFHLSPEMQPHNLHKEKKSSSVFHYDELENYNVQQRYLATRCETEAYCFATEHAYRNQQLFTNQDAHNAVSAETFNVATDGSFFHEQRCGFGVALGQDGTMYRSQMSHNSPNETEARGIALAIKNFACVGRHLVIHTDSEWAMRRIYMAHNPQDFENDKNAVADCVKELDNAIEHGYKVSFVKVKSHSGDIMNNSVDKIARMSVRQALNPDKKKSYDTVISNEIIKMMKKLHGKQQRHVVLKGDTAKVVTTV